jgi:hypothetical protein
VRGNAAAGEEEEACGGGAGRYMQHNSPYLQPTSGIKWVTRDIPWLIANKAQVPEHWNRLVTSIKR